MPFLWDMGESYIHSGVDDDSNAPVSIIWYLYI